MNERASQGGGPHRWWHPLVLWCPPLLGVCWVLAIEPGPATTPPCPSMKLLQVPCPACGTLRGLHSLGQGEWERAFALQPLLAVLLATIVTLLFARKPVLAFWSRCSLRARRRFAWVLGVLFLVWWAARIMLHQRGLAGPV